MAEPITLQELKEASEDALTLKDFMYKPSDVLVGRRLAPDIQSLQYYLDFLHGLELVYSQQSGTVTVNGVETKTVTQAVQDAINSNTSVFKGDKGDSGTIETLTVSTGAAGTSVQVTLGGTPQAREIALTVPRGDKGETGDLPNIYAETTANPPNVFIGPDGTFKRSNDTANAASRKVGTAQGQLAERNASGSIDGIASLGVGQTWYDMTGSRSQGIVYTNSTGKPIYVMASAIASGGGNKTWMRFRINGATDVFSGGDASYSTSSMSGGSCIIPNGATYQIDLVQLSGQIAISSTLQTWAELR